VLPDDVAVHVQQRSWRFLPAGTLPQRLAVIAARDEADFLALRLLGRGQAMAPRHVAHLRLGELAERETRARQLVLAQPDAALVMDLAGTHAASSLLLGTLLAWRS